MKKFKGFTLAEVVITLIVIGIVSAVTIPMLSSNVNDKKWNTARQKAQTSLGEAFRLMAVNGEIDKTKSTQEFVEKIIPKYLKLAKTCTISNAKNCGMSTAANFYRTPDGTKVQLPTNWSSSSSAKILSGNSPRQIGVWGSITGYNHSNPDTNNSYMFQTLDGFSVNFFYNPYCAVDETDKYRLDTSLYYQQQSLDIVCFMGVYDMNGAKGPNKVGMDVGFVGSFYNGFGNKSMAVLPHSNINQIINRLPHTGNDYIGGAIKYCDNLDKEHSWILPSQDELSLLFLNQKLVWNTNNYMNRVYYARITRGYVNGYKVIGNQVNFTNNRNGSRGIEYTIDGNAGANGDNYSICVRNNALK